MAENSKIEWTHHTFNPWRGCTKVSDGCKHCYAETMSKRNLKVLGQWGPGGTRVIAAEAMWREPLKWDSAARSAGERHRVFCASLADIGERPDTMPAASVGPVRAARHRLLNLIHATPSLDWLLLTKRPESWMDCLDEAALDCRPGDLCEMLNAWRHGTAPANVWMGTSIEAQPEADKRIPHLLRIPAVVRFLSVEPMLGAIDLDYPRDVRNWLTERNRHVDWVIVGGESGPGARPMHPNWARSLRDQCQDAGVPFFFKQWGEFRPAADGAERESLSQKCLGPVKGRMQESAFGPDGKIGKGQWDTNGGLGDTLFRVGKKKAGRLLDGREWNEMPEAIRAR